MKIKNISLSYGIRRSPSLGNDGELSELINLIPIRGELVNIQPPKELGITVPEGSRIIYIHKTSMYTNYILSSEVQGRITLKYISNENPSQITDIYTFPTSTTIKQVQSIGNTIIVFTDKGMEYILYKEGTYRYIGNKIPEIELVFSLFAGYDLHHTNRNIDLRGTTPVINNVLGEMQFIGDAKTEITNEILSLLNPLLKEAREYGLFYAPFFVRYAYRTTLGEYTYISSPVLMVPNSGAFPFIELLEGFEFNTIIGTATTKDENWASLVFNGSRFKTAKKISFRFNSCTLLCKVLNTEALQIIMDDWSDIISNIDIFITQPQSRLRQDGTSLIISTNGALSYPNKNKGGYMAINGNNNNIVHGYSGDYNPENVDRLILPQYTDDEYIKMMEQQSVFRLLKSFNIDELRKEITDNSSNFDGFIRINPGTLENLGTRPALDTTYDYNSHDTLIPEYSFVYNQRLNISNVKRYPYCPTPAMSFTYTNGFLDEIGNAKKLTYEYEIFAFFAKNSTPIKIESKVSNLNATPSWIFIPHANVTKIVIQRTRNGTSQYAELPMKEHSMLNGSYYIGSGYFESDEIKYTNEKPSILGEKYTDYVIEQNKIYTSEVGNPFIFPLNGINTVGLGEIRGIAAATKALSQGQFGQFPLYAFSTDGIWALEVSGTGLYESIHPISRDVCTNPASITPIDAAIVFATEQGLKLLQGSDITLISSVMDGENTDESMFNVKPEFAHLFIADTDPFVQMIATCTIAYDYSHNLLHIFPQGDGTKHYVYSLDSGEYSTYVGYAMKSYVPGYPQGIIQIGNRLHTFQRYTSADLRKGVAVTKQLAFDDPFAMKLIHDLRTLCHRTADGTQMRVSLFVSNDGYHWARLRSLRMHSFKFYRLVLFSTMTDNDAIPGVTFQFEYCRTNKLR